MMVFNSFTATNDNNFGMQMTEWQICLAIVGNFFRGSYETNLLKTIYLVLSLFMNMSAK